MRLLLLGPFLALAVILACGGSTASTSESIATLTPTETPTEAAGDVEITDRVETALALASEGNWLEAWEFYALSFRESCPRETFAAQATSGMNMFCSFVELPADARLEFRLMNVTVNGNTALVSTQIFHQGELLEYGAKDELDSWVLIDGEWWNNVPPGPYGCVN